MSRRVEIGPAYPPRAMRAEQAAAYLSMSPSAFYRLVEDRVFPAGTKVGGMVLWDRYDLDAAFEDLKQGGPKQRNSMRQLLGMEDPDG